MSLGFISDFFWPIFKNQLRDTSEVRNNHQDLHRGRHLVVDQSRPIVSQPHFSSSTSDPFVLVTPAWRSLVQPKNVQRRS